MALLASDLSDSFKDLFQYKIQGTVTKKLTDCIFITKRIDFLIDFIHHQNIPLKYRLTLVSRT